jgi:hypothetical protein
MVSLTLQQSSKVQHTTRNTAAECVQLGWRLCLSAVARRGIDAPHDHAVLKCGFVGFASIGYCRVAATQVHAPRRCCMLCQLSQLPGRTSVWQTSGSRGKDLHQLRGGTSSTRAGARLLP